MLSVLMFLCAVCVLASCSGQLFVAQQGETGLRAVVNGKFNQLEWAEELSPEGLAQPQAQKHAVEAPQSLAALASGSAVYPDLEGFGSLDNSLLPRALVNKLDALLGKLPEITDTEFLSPDHAYLAVYLKYTFGEFRLKRWLYGKPAYSAGLYEIPLRLYGDSRYMDAVAHVRSRDGSFTLEQLQAGELIHE